MKILAASQGRKLAHWDRLLELGPMGVKEIVRNSTSVI
jgi:hypothetical protein